MTQLQRDLTSLAAPVREPGQRPPGHVWHRSRQPRIAPVEPARQTWLLRFVLRLIHSRAGIKGQPSVPLNVFGTVANDRGLFYRWLAFASRLMPFGRLPRADTERVILRVGWRTGSWYEWAQHVRIGKDAGLSTDEIDDLQLDNAPGWTPRTRALMQATDALIRHHYLDDALWAQLREHLNDKHTLEFCMLVGHYVMLAMTLNTLGVVVESPYDLPA